MGVLSAVGRGTVSGARATGRGIRATGRGLSVGGRATGRGSRRLYRWLADPDPLLRDRRNWLFVSLVWSVTAAMFFTGFGTASYTYDVGLGVAPFIGAVAALPLALIAFRRPTLGWGLSVTGAYLLAVMLPFQHRDPWPWTVVHGLVMLTLLFAVCARERIARGVGAWLVTVALFAWGVSADVRAGWLVGVSAVAVLGLLAGMLARTERSLVQQEQLTSAEKTRRMVLEERARIARDLHDIVAHHMSLIVVQAETAPYRLPDLPPEVRAELASISASARSALDETRSLLTVLRQDDQHAEHAPQPGLELLDDLVQGVRRAGTPIVAAVHGGVDGLRPGTSLAAYRVVQEALANASRHAPGAAVRLEVVRDQDTLTLAVINDAADRIAQPGEPGDETSGHGIMGMRERVTAEGGTLQVGPTGTGGFAVQATLPLTTLPSTTPPLTTLPSTTQPRTDR